MGDFKYYDSYVTEQAGNLMSDYKDELFDKIRDGESVDLGDFFDTPVHEWADNDFIYVDLHDCADILEGSENVETDSGLWNGQDPIAAVKTMAFFTYRTDLMENVKAAAQEQLIEWQEELNDDIRHLDEKKEQLEGKMADLQAELDDLDEEEDEAAYESLLGEIDDIDNEIQDIDGKLEGKQAELDNVNEVIAIN